MAHDARDWRIELIEAHPNLFHPAGPQPVRGYPSCGEGWRDLLERACARIEAALAEGGAFYVFQIKEKFGALRFYWYGEVSLETRTKIDEAIALAEARSTCTCETCGEPGRLHQISGWYTTACGAHAPADVEPVPVKPGRENVHVVSTATPDGFRRVPRRYDRATDSFVDIESGSPGIQEEWEVEKVDAAVEKFDFIARIEPPEGLNYISYKAVERRREAMFVFGCAGAVLFVILCGAAAAGLFIAGFRWGLYLLVGIPLAVAVGVALMIPAISRDGAAHWLPRPLRDLTLAILNHVRGR